MDSEYQKWQEIKTSYLKQIEKNLAEIDQLKRSEILANVSEHLDSKYNELSLEQKNWESFQQIITEMGPPEEYAELLTGDNIPKTKTSPGINAFLAIFFIIILAAVGSYLIYMINKKPVTIPVPTAEWVKFELDDQVLGKWITVDFVERIEDFNPKKKSWQGGLFLQSLEFQDNGEVEWRAENRKPWLLKWTKGKVSQNKNRPAFYYLRKIDGQIYLFYEWVSGDVTERGRAPSYYVLKQVRDGETFIPEWFKNDPQAIGYWISVDFVEAIEAFNPEQPHTENLFIKTLNFKDNGMLYWTIGDSQPIGLNWTRGTIRPSGIWPALYTIKNIAETDYLFYEYRTGDRNPEGYYVFKRASRPDETEETEKEIFENDSQVLGKWITVDFVKTPDDFRPDQRSWGDKLWVKSLNFQELGVVEWCLGQDNMKINHRWTKGKLLDDELDAHYFIKTYDNGDYLFMEWNSGDVTIRGQKPAYYVLKKED